MMMMSVRLSMVMMVVTMMSVHVYDGCDDDVCPSVPAGGGQSVLGGVTDSRTPAWSEAGR